MYMIVFYFYYIYIHTHIHIYMTVYALGNVTLDELVERAEEDPEQDKIFFFNRHDLHHKLPDSGKRQHQPRP